MKDSKFWIWFIPLFLILCLGIYITLNKVTNKQSTTESINSLKSTYEKYNDTLVKVDLSINNVYKEVNFDELKDRLDSKNFILFLGNAKDNKARKTISLLNEMVSSTSIDYVIYFDIDNLSDEQKSYLENIFDVTASNTYAIKDKNVIASVIENITDDNSELDDKTKEDLLVKYKNLASNYVEACNESC